MDNPPFRVSGSLLLCEFLEEYPALSAKSERGKIFPSLSMKCAC